MNASIDPINKHRDASRQRKSLLRLMRGGVMLAIVLAGCVSLSAMRGAVAAPMPVPPDHATTSSVSSLAHHVYYYRNRYYPYRYRGAYYGHRYYRYGRWHYY